MAVRMQVVMRSLAVSVGQSLSSPLLVLTCLCTAGIGFLFGLLTLLIRTENREPRGVHSPHNPHNHSEPEGVSGPVREVVFHSKKEEAHKGEDKLAVELAEKVKVLCWVMTGPDNHQAKVILFRSPEVKEFQK